MGRTRRRVTRQADSENPPNFSGDIIIRNFGSNVTELAVSYVIPLEALEMVQENNPNYTGQYSVVYYRQNLFSSELNVSQVLSTKFISLNYRYYSYYITI